MLSRCRVSSTKTLLSSVVIGSVGCLLLIEWPYLINGDSCDSHSVALSPYGVVSDIDTCDDTSPVTCYSLYASAASADVSFNIQYCNDNLNSSNCTSFLVSNGTVCQHQSNIAKEDLKQISADLDFYFLTNISLTQEFNKTLISLLHYIQEVRVGQQQCINNTQCYWNPQSVVSGRRCRTCPSFCRQKSDLPFGQICVGVCLVILSEVIGRYIIQPVMGKVTPLHLRVCACTVYMVTINRYAGSMVSYYSIIVTC